MAHDYKAKIEAMLAKAERTDNEHERDAYNAQAERLMIKMGIDAAELEAAGTVKPEQVIQIEREYGGNYSIIMIPFCNQMRLAFGHIQMLQWQSSHTLLRRAFLIGHVSDLEAFTALENSVEAQAMSALKRWQRDNRDVRRYQTDQEKYLANRSFLAAFGRVAASRLRDMRQVEEAEVSTGAALVLVSKEERVEAAMAEMYPETKAARQTSLNGSLAGSLAGAAAGRNANLGEKSLPGSRGQIN